MREAGANTRIVRGNEPLVLDGSATWVVVSGSLAVFALHNGVRRYLFTANAEEALLWRPCPVQLLIVALEETVLDRVDVADIPAAMVQRWAEHLGGGAENGGDPLTFLASLQGRFIESLEREDALHQESGLQKRRERRHATEALTRQAIEDLTTFSKPGSREITWATSPLLAAVQCVGQAQGIEIAAPREGHGSRDPLAAILHTNHVRARRVLLSGDWWMHDAGPLVAFREDSKEPAALIPRPPRGVSRSRYDMYSASGGPIPVDRVLAHSLDPVAWSVYAPLPAGADTHRLIQAAFKGRSRDIAVLTVAALATTAMGMLTPQATLILMEHAIPGADRMMLLHVGLGLLAASFGALLFDLARAFSMLRIETYSIRYLQAGLFDRLLKQSPAFFRNFTSGDLASRSHTATQLQQVLNESTVSTAFMGIIGLLNLGLMFYYSSRLALGGLAVGAVAGVVSAVGSCYMMRVIRPLQEIEGNLFGLLVQLIGAVPKLRVAGAEERAFAKWGMAYGRKQRLRLQLQEIADHVRVFGLLLTPVASALLFWLAAGIPQNDGAAAPMSLGAFLAFNAAFGAFLSGTTALGDVSSTLLLAANLWRRMMPILEAVPEIDPSRSDPGKLRGRLEIDNVTFRYREDGPLTLDNVSIRAGEGECIAIVGPSGSGKSTLVNLLLRFDSPASGAIYYDGQDLNGLDVTAVRRQLGVVTQDNRITSGSIYENIACGSLVTLNEAMEAARRAGLGEDIERMPMGLHTLVSEMGGNISGGQRQRLLIARALVQKPRILILDEATSALDNRTQAAVTASLDALSVTRVIIAHRLSTIRNAHRIYVLDAGRVVQEGTFKELLMDSTGMFARLMQRQML